MVKLFIETLKEEGFTMFIHKSGFRAWSIENLCEVSDEWEKEYIPTKNELNQMHAYNSK